MTQGLRNRNAATCHVAAIATAFLVVAAFAGALNNQLVNWDDLQNLVENDAYRGLSGEQIAWALSTTHGGHYQPLTWLSFSLDWVIWGGRPVGFHLTNILLHALTAVLIFHCARQLLRAANPERTSRSVVCGAAFAAAFFAVHPLRVESVAWATERRDVLAGALLAASLLLYLRAQDGRAVRPGLLVASVIAFMCSLLAKASGMTFPLVLLALDAYPLRRLSGRDGRTAEFRAALLEKVPYAAFAILSAGAAAWAQRSAGAMWSLGEHPLSLRVAQAAYGLVFYIRKTILPTELIPLYAQPADAVWYRAEYLVSAAVVAAMVAAVFLARKRLPGLVTASVCYVLLIAPVLGFAQSGPQVVADRYSYFACASWAVLLGAVLAGRLDRLDVLRLQKSRRFLLAAAACIIVTLTVMTRAQVEVWSDSRTLWETTIRRAPETGLAYANLAAVELENGNLPQTIALAEAALERLPGNFAAYRIAATALLELGFHREAEQYFKMWLVRIRPGDERRDFALAGIARAQVTRGDIPSAERTFTSSAPNASAMETALWLMAEGAWQSSHDRFDIASLCLERAIELVPESGWPPFAMAMLARDRGAREESHAMLLSLLEREDIRLEPELERRVEMALSEMAVSETSEDD